MTESERKEKALTLFNIAKPIVMNLYARWLDESEYEDIADYGKIFKTEVEKMGGTFLKMNKRPWGFTAQIGDGTYLYSVNRSAYSYKRIG